MLRFIVAALLLVQLVTAVQVDPASQGATILKPSGGDAAHGVTVMAPADASTAATSACATGNCQQQAPAAPAASSAPAAAPVSATTGKPMHPALINHPTNQCGCPQEDDACACNKPKFVAPEIKAEPCGCMQEESCACRSAPLATVSVSTDECGCLHLTECGCRRPTLEPETRENTVVPEVRDNVITTSSSCGCPQEDTSCGCHKPQYVAPELKVDPCACQNQVDVECACSHFRPNF